ncbi:MAG: YqgE/AlgH family protein [Pirellula sp.]|jgi:putative transcriptional regulator|nr:YqgE/AlgH family protein [Pirellula sp.]
MNRIALNPNHAPLPRISLAGFLLVASPSQNQGVFEQSVCLILEHSESKAVGIVLNKPMQVNFASLLSQVAPDVSSKASHKLLHFGGPESGPILAVHDVPEFAEGGNKLGVYLSAQVEHLKQLAESNTRQLKLYAGSLIWGPAELDRQIVSGHWHVLPAVPEIVFDDESEMWSKAMRSIANQIYFEATGIDLNGYNCQFN